MASTGCKLRQLAKDFPPVSTVRRRDRQILMTVEHRAAPGLNDIEVELADHGKGPALRLRQVDTAEAGTSPETPERRILRALAEAEMPLAERQIRERAATRHKTVADILQKLVREGRIRHDDEGRYSIIARQSEMTAPGTARSPVPGSAHP